MNQRILHFALLLATTAALTGCKSTFWSFSNKWNVFEINERGKLDEFGKPVQMAVIWKDAVLSGVGQKSTRGFGGRIYFYDAENKTVKADGELTVFGFDDSSSEISPEPDRKYVFKQDEFQHHFGETDLGLSYSIWVPWDKVGGLRKTVALLPVFKTADGHLIKANQTIVVLPGVNPPDKTVEQTSLPLRMLGSSPAVLAAQRAGSQAESSSRFGNVQVAHQEPPTSDLSDPKLRTTTIQVPKSLGHQMSAATPPAALPSPGNSSNDPGASTTLYQQLQEQNQLDDNTTVSYGSSPLIGRVLPGTPSVGNEPAAGQGANQVRQAAHPLAGQPPQVNFPGNMQRDSRVDPQRVFGMPGSIR